MNIEYHVYVVPGRLNDALPTGMNWLECPMCCRVNGRGRVNRFLPHRRQSYRAHIQGYPNGLQVLLNWPHCSSRPKRTLRRRQYSHHTSRIPHPSGTYCRRCGIYHTTPVRRISYRAAPRGSWVQKQSRFSSITPRRNGEVHPKSTVIQSGGGVHARGDRRDH